MVEKIVKIFKALSDENRLKIIKLLKNNEVCACELEKNLDLTQSGLSYHLKILSDCELILKRPEGNWIHYRINKSYDEIIELIDKLLVKS